MRSEYERRRQPTVQPRKLPFEYNGAHAVAEGTNQNISRSSTNKKTHQSGSTLACSSAALRLSDAAAPPAPPPGSKERIVRRSEGQREWIERPCWKQTRQRDGRGEEATSAGAIRADVHWPKASSAEARWVAYSSIERLPSPPSAGHHLGGAAAEGPFQHV
jgi:hypothetical protein